MVWDCPRCTFKNAASSTVCDMCECPFSSKGKSGMSDDGEWIVSKSGKGTKANTRSTPSQRLVPRIVDTSTKLIIPQALRPVVIVDPPKQTKEEDHEMKTVGGRMRIAAHKPSVAANQSVGMPKVKRKSVPPTVKPSTITCPTCTLENPISLSYCNACDSSLPFVSSEFTTVQSRSRKPVSTPQPSIIVTETISQSIIPMAAISKKVTPEASEEWVEVKKKMAVKPVRQVIQDCAPTDYYSTLLKLSGASSKGASLDVFIDDENETGAKDRHSSDAPKVPEIPEPVDIILEASHPAPINTQWGQRSSNNFKEKIIDVDKSPSVSSSHEEDDLLSPYVTASPLISSWAQRPPSRLVPVVKAAPSLPTPIDFPADLGVSNVPTVNASWGKPLSKITGSEIKRDSAGSLNTKANDIAPKPATVVAAAEEATLRTEPVKNTPPVMTKIPVLDTTVKHPSVKPTVKDCPVKTLGRAFPSSPSPSPSRFAQEPVPKEELFKREKKPKDIEIAPILFSAPLEDPPQCSSPLFDAPSEAPPVVPTCRSDHQVPSDLPPSPPDIRSPQTANNDSDCLLILNTLNHFRVCVVKIADPKVANTAYLTIGANLDFSFSMHDIPIVNRRVVILVDTDAEVWEMSRKIASSAAHAPIDFGILEVDSCSTPPQDWTQSFAYVPHQICVSSEAISEFNKIVNAAAAEMMNTVIPPPPLHPFNHLNQNFGTAIPHHHNHLPPMMSPPTNDLSWNVPWRHMRNL
eukprot:GHVH01000094.1.p1 GENE.GHVH01000094.1~~GHVH01000094.1.p1  ORF type:complete len:746 (-),score=94.84 GHVH01000094.1:55-2292(-)